MRRPRITLRGLLVGIACIALLMGVLISMIRIRPGDVIVENVDRLTDRERFDDRTREVERLSPQDGMMMLPSSAGMGGEELSLIPRDRA